MSAYTDPVAHQVDQYFTGRHLEQAAAQTTNTSNENTGR